MRIKLQMKIIENDVGLESFEEEVNQFLATVSAVDVKVTKLKEEWRAVIQYEIQEG